MRDHWKDDGNTSNLSAFCVEGLLLLISILKVSNEILYN